MKHYLAILLTCFFVVGIFNSCEKESNFYSGDNQSTVISEYAVQAEELLAQLPAEELDLLTAEEIDAFKKGPDANAMRLATRSAFQIKRQWHPVLAVFYCKTENDVVKGSGFWYGRHNADLMIAQDLDMEGGFFNPGAATITDENGYTLDMIFSAFQPFAWQGYGMKQ